MNKKAKLTIKIASLVLILALFVIAIVAIASGHFDIGGDINITAPDIEAKITGKIYGHHKDHMTEDVAENLTGADWKAEDFDGEENTLDWDNLNLNFVNKETDIVIVISITNNGEKELYVTVDNKTQTEDKNFTLTIQGSGTATENVVTKGETIVYTMTFHILDANKSVSGTFDVDYNISTI